MQNSAAGGKSETESESFEAVLRLYSQSPSDLRRAALRACAEILSGFGTSTPNDPRLTLKELGRVLRRHPSLLWRLGVVAHCGESYGGGRNLYRERAVLEYLQSETALKYREQMRRKRGSSKK